MLGADERVLSTARAVRAELHVEAGRKPPSGIFMTRASGSVVEARTAASLRLLRSNLAAHGLMIACDQPKFRETRFPDGS